MNHFWGTLFFLFVWYTVVVAQVDQTPRLVVPIGHTEFVNSVAFSPDGKTVLTSSFDKTAKLWDLQGRELQTFSPHIYSVRSVAFSPDGKTILTCSINKAFLWDLQGRKLQTFYGHESYVNDISFSPDGKSILTSSDDGTAKLWDLQGRELQTFKGHNYSIWAVDFSPDGNHILTGSKDSTAILWDLQGQIVRTFASHTSEVRSVAFSPDGKTILTGSKDKSIKLWDLQGQELKSFSGNGEIINSVAFSPDGKSILVGSDAESIELWDLEGQVIQTFSGHTASIRAIAFSLDGKSIMSGSVDNTAKLWDLQGRELQSFTGHAVAVTSVAFSPDGKSAFTGTLDRKGKLWDLQGRAVETFSGHTSSVWSVAFSPDGESVLTGSLDNTAKLWDLEGRELQSFTNHSNRINSVAFSPDGKNILTGSHDKTAKLWDLEGQVIETFSGHSAAVNSVAFSPDGKNILTGSEDKTVKLWDLEGRELQTFSGHSGAVWSVSFSPDGTSILSGSLDKTARLWDSLGQVTQTFSGHTAFVSSAAFSPDGKNILTGSTDKTAKLWDLEGQIIKNFTGHASSVVSVAFSPDGKHILTSSYDNTSKLWDPIDGVNLATLIIIDADDWVITAPSGLFDASPDAMLNMHFMVGQEVVALEQLKERYFEPGLLSQALGFLEEESREISDMETLDLYPEVNAEIHANQFNINLKVRSGGMGKLSFFINGKEVIEDLNPDRKTSLIIDLNSYNDYFLPGDNILALRAYDQDNWLKSSAIEHAYTPTIWTIETSTETDTHASQDLDSTTITSQDIDSTIIVSQDVDSTTIPSQDVDSTIIASQDVDSTTIPSQDVDSTIIASQDVDSTIIASQDVDSTIIASQDIESTIIESRDSIPNMSKGVSTNTNKEPDQIQLLRTHKPHLYAIVVGTSDYAGEDLDLKFPDHDASSIAYAIQAVGSRLFEDRVHLRLLTTDAKNPGDISSKANIEAAFEDYAKVAKPSDIIVAYFSGHGISYGFGEKSQFYYLTKDISSPDLDDQEIRDNFTVSSENLTSWLTTITAQKQVMILDACNSGKVVESFANVGARGLNPKQIRAFDRMKDRTGMFILTGSAADKVSFEASQYGQGLLTYSLLQGVRGPALTPDKRVDVMTLFQYARDEVPNLAKNIKQVQEPVLSFPNGGASFDLGFVDAEVNIPLAEAKPVFIRNTFQDSDSFNDGLGLTNALAEYFQQITSRGVQAEIIYMDVSDYENAYSIKGLYTINGDEVTVRGRLFQGESVKAEFEVLGNKTDIPLLVESIIEKVSGEL